MVIIYNTKRRQKSLLAQPACRKTHYCAGAFLMASLTDSSAFEI